MLFTCATDSLLSWRAQDDQLKRTFETTRERSFRRRIRTYWSFLDYLHDIHIIVTHFPTLSDQQQIGWKELCRILCPSKGERAHVRVYICVCGLGCVQVCLKGSGGTFCLLVCFENAQSHHVIPDICAGFMPISAHRFLWLMWCLWASTPQIHGITPPVLAASPKSQNRT